MDNTELAHTSKSYDVLKEDAEELLKLVNKYVKVQLIKENEVFGFVHSIDPIQFSIILLTQKENSHTVTVIPGHAIVDVTEIQETTDLKIPELKLATPTSCDDNGNRKRRLMAWLKKNLLEITECEGKIVFGKVQILPPYNVSSICTDNPIVAMQVRKFIENMPLDFDPDQ